MSLAWGFGEDKEAAQPLAIICFFMTESSSVRESAADVLHLVETQAFLFSFFSLLLCSSQEFGHISEMCHLCLIIYTTAIPCWQSYLNLSFNCTVTRPWRKGGCGHWSFQRMNAKVHQGFSRLIRESPPCFRLLRHSMQRAAATEPLRFVIFWEELVICGPTGVQQEPAVPFTFFILTQKVSAMYL